MKLLIFDTETTGLPVTREKAVTGPNNWPHIVSISWILLDSDTNTELKRRSHIIKPLDWTIPEESVKIHGITTAFANQFGESLYDVMNELLLEPCDMMIAHNMDFDMNVLMHAILWDLKLQCPVVRPRKVCTMLLGKNICKLPGMYKGYKPPKLKELYYHTFGEHPKEEHLHNSMYDVEILKDIIKMNTELREAMGLIKSNSYTPDGRTLTIKLNDDMGK